MAGTVQVMTADVSTGTETSPGRDDRGDFAAHNTAILHRNTLPSCPSRPCHNAGGRAWTVQDYVARLDGAHGTGRYVMLQCKKGGPGRVGPVAHGVASTLTLLPSSGPIERVPSYLPLWRTRPIKSASYGNKQKMGGRPTFRPVRSAVRRISAYRE